MRNPLYPFEQITNSFYNYSRCLVITLKKNPEKFMEDIFLEEIDDSKKDEYLKYINEHYEIHVVPMWVVRSVIKYYEKYIFFSVTEDDMIPFEFKAVDLENNQMSYNLTELVTLFPNHEWKWFYAQIELFIIDGLKELCNFVNTYKDDLVTMIQSNEMVTALFNIKKSRDVLHWTDIYKCQINITTQWINRDMKFSDAKEISCGKQKEMEDKCDDYMKNAVNKNKYVDASSGIKTHKYSLYYLDEYTNLPIDNYLLKLMSNGEKYKSLILSLIKCILVSKKYTHCILKNVQIIQWLKDNANINDYMKEFGYAWLMMYLEEGIHKSYIKEEDRCIFTLSDARHLPNQLGTWSNYYLPLMVEQRYIVAFGGYYDVNDLHFCLIKLATHREFYDRVKLFINDYDLDVFEGLNWKNLGMCGSIIPATCRAKDPLEKNISTSEFFDLHYANSDVDIMCDLQDYKSFFDKVYYFISIVEKNIQKKFPLEKVEYEITKNGALHINKKYVNELMDGVINNEIAYEMYKNLKLEEIKNNKNEGKYAKIDEIVKMENFKYYLYYNDKKTDKVSYSENIKFHVTSKHLKRKFEIFKIQYTFLATVSRFHLPCVRGYYDGNEVYLLPSAISALITNKCMDYKYFAGSKSPFEIVLKYVQRGFTIMFNKKEMVKIAEYIKNNDKWKQIFKWDENFKTNIYNNFYCNPRALCNYPSVKYSECLYSSNINTISPIISTLGYVIPYTIPNMGIN